MLEKTWKQYIVLNKVTFYIIFDDRIWNGKTL
jgi:hypothetical protein